MNHSPLLITSNPLSMNGVSVRLFTTVAALQCYLNSHRSVRPRIEIGLVPTMGALHQGHLSLIERARQENALVVVSIFVNPLQFGPSEDFQKYPRSLERDRQLCAEAGVDAIFAPAATEMFPVEDVAAILNTQAATERVTVVPPTAMAERLCGKARPGHFEGVCTVVAKLLNLVGPTKAYFGQKDAQQVAIVQRLGADLNFPGEIVACPTVREPSGLACSSRNQYLTPEQQEQATVLFRSLRQAQQVFLKGERRATELLEAVRAELAKMPEVQAEYVELVDPKTLQPLAEVEEAGLLAVAARVGSTRLIDNLILRNRLPIVAIDGPAGAGKSTVTRLAAKTLGLLYLDTGAMYRAVTWLVLQSGIALEDEPAIAELVSQCHIEFKHENSQTRIEINGQDVTTAIRSSEVTAKVSAVAAQPAVRSLMLKQQRQYGRQGGIVAEGRDIGTNVFPDAEVKVFLTASLSERARRRLLELKEQGRGEMSLEQLEREIAERDEKDSTREVAPLRKATDAVEIQTDGLSIEEVLHRIVSLYQERSSPQR